MDLLKSDIKPISAFPETMTANMFVPRILIINIINNLRSNKATGPHSIPTDILQLIKCNISKPLSEILNLSFSTSIYPNKLKIAEVMPVFKNKGSPLVSYINNIYEKLMYSRLYNFLISITAYTISSLDLGENIPPIMH